MKPGPQMDAEIARKIWRAIVIHEGGEFYMHGLDDGAKVPIPKFSTDATDTNRLIEFFQNKGYSSRIILNKRPIGPNGTDGWSHTIVLTNINGSYTGEHVDLAMAVCLAALAVHEGTNGNP